MSASPTYERFPMLYAAWDAAMSLVDDRGNLRGDLGEAGTRFLKRKSCQGLGKDDCRTVFHTAVEIAQATTHFRRTKCGALQPKPARRYELLFSLATDLEARFPHSDPALIMAACRTLELRWDR